MGYFFWEPIPRSSTDPTRIAAFVAALLAAQDELSELQDVNIPAPTDGQVLVYNAATAKWIAGAAGGVGDLSWNRYMRIGRTYYSIYCIGNPAQGIPISANYLHASPFPIAVQMTFDRIGIYVYYTGAGVSRLGIYTDDGCYPASLVLDAGTVNVATAGWKEIAIDQTLTPGLYWIVVHPEVNHSVDGNPQDFVPSLLGFDPRNLAKHSWLIAQAYGALPATFPAGATLYGRFYGIGLRRSA